MWVTYYFLADNFIFEDVVDIQTGTQVTEAFCYSSIQCWMFIVNYGIRAGGGIADALGKISFNFLEAINPSPDTNILLNLYIKNYIVLYTYN